MCPKCRAGTANDLQNVRRGRGGNTSFFLRGGLRDISFDSWLNNLVFQNNLGRWSIVVRLLSLAAVWMTVYSMVYFVGGPGTGQVPKLNFSLDHFRRGPCSLFPVLCCWPKNPTSCPRGNFGRNMATQTMGQITGQQSNRIETKPIPRKAVQQYNSPKSRFKSRALGHKFMTFIRTSD